MNRFKQARKDCNMTQNQVAEVLNITAATLSRYESGSIKPDPDMLKMMASIYNVSVDYLLGAENDETPQYPTEQIKELAELFDKLSKEDQEYIIRITRGFAQEGRGDKLLK